MWSHDGLICTGETYKNVVKMTFSRGASLDDPSIDPALGLARVQQPPAKARLILPRPFPPGSDVLPFGFSDTAPFPAPLPPEVAATSEG